MPADRAAHRLVLTGASGMLGGAILEQLSGRDDTSVVALNRRPLKNVGGTSASRPIEHRLIDFDSDDAIAGALDEIRPTVFMHTAATGMLAPLPDAETLRKINIELPARLAAAAARVPGCHFVHVSSGLAYTDQGRPLREEDPLGTAHPYGASKVEAEQRLREIAEKQQIPLTIMRPFSFTGKGDIGSRLFPSLLRSAESKQPFAMSSGEQVRDHSSVNDIARGVVAAAFSVEDDSSSAPRVFNLGSGDVRPLRDLVLEVVAQLGIETEIQFGARALSAHEPMFMVADSTRAQNLLNWRPQESVAQAVWQLARASHPSLNLKERFNHE